MAMPPEELHALQMEDSSRSELSEVDNVRSLSVRPKRNIRKYAGVVSITVIISMTVAFFGKSFMGLHGHTVQSGELGDIVEACGDYTLESTCMAALCDWNAAVFECRESVRKGPKTFLTAAEREDSSANSSVSPTAAACTITDGSAFSTGYPCTCGNIECATANMKCTVNSSSANSTGTCTVDPRACDNIDGTTKVQPIPCNCGTTTCTRLGQSCNVKNVGMECSTIWTAYPVPAVTPTAAPTAAPAATPSVPTPAGASAVQITYVIAGVDCTALTQNAALKASLELAQKEAIAEEAGTQITTAMVTIVFSCTGRRLEASPDGRRLSTGVNAQATVNAPTGVQASTLQQQLSASSSLSNTLQTKSAAVPNINTVASGGVTVSNLAVAASSSSTSSGSLCASHISWGNCFAALTAGKTTAEITALCTLVRQAGGLPSSVSQDIVALNQYYHAATADQQRMNHALEMTGHCGTR